MGSDSYGPNIDYSDPFNLEENVRKALGEHTRPPGGGVWLPSKIEEEIGADISLMDMGSSMYAMNSLQTKKTEFRTSLYMDTLDRATARGGDFLRFSDFNELDRTDILNSNDPLTNASRSISNPVIELDGIKVTPAGRTFPVAAKKDMRIDITNNFGVFRGGSTTVPHGGVDIRAPGILGTPVVAIENARINKLFYASGAWMGNAVLLESLLFPGMMYLYAHLHNFKEGISNGTTVNVGQVLGFVGDTGKSYGPHLHFEIRTSPYGLGTPNGAKDPYPRLIKIQKDATIPLEDFLSDGSISAEDVRREDPRTR